MLFTHYRVVLATRLRAGQYLPEPARIRKIKRFSGRMHAIIGVANYLTVHFEDGSQTTLHKDEEIFVACPAIFSDAPIPDQWLRKYEHADLT